jgi:RNA 2',3'-cyclic 3'-phosphodiesterase
MPGIGPFFRASWRDLRASRRQDVAYKRIWSNFAHHPTTADGRHDTPDWRSRSGPFAICIIRVPARLLQPSLDELRAGLSAFPFVRLHPDHFFHITLQELGFLNDKPARQDEVTRARVDEFLAASRAAFRDAVQFDVRLGGANSFQDAAFLDVHDRGQCSRMHTRLREIAAIPTQPRYAYVPHSTVAHYTEEQTVPELPKTIAHWSDRRFGSFTVRELEVVTLEVSEPYPELVPIGTIPLAG